MADGGYLDGILEFKDVTKVIIDVQAEKKDEQVCQAKPPQLGMNYLEVAVSELNTVKAAHAKLVAEKNELIRALQSSSSLAKVNLINLMYFAFNK